MQEARPPAEQEGATLATGRIDRGALDDGAVATEDQTGPAMRARWIRGEDGRSTARAGRGDDFDCGVAERIGAGLINERIGPAVAHDRRWGYGSGQ